MADTKDELLGAAEAAAKLNKELAKIQNSKALQDLKNDTTAAQEEIKLYQANMGLLSQTMTNTAKENFNLLEHELGAQQRIIENKIKERDLEIEKIELIKGQLKENEDLSASHQNLLATLRQENVEDEGRLVTAGKTTQAYQAMGNIINKNYEVLTKIGGAMGLQRNMLVDGVKYYGEQYKAVVQNVQGWGALEKRMAGAGKTQAMMLGGLNGAIKHTKALGVVAANAAKSFFDIFSVSNILGSVIKKIWSTSLGFMKEISAATSQFNAASGTAGTMAKDVTAAMDFGIGVSAAEVGEAASGLANSFTEFTSVSKGARTSLVKTASGLGRLGISSTTTGKNLQFMTKAMGQSSEDAENTLKGLASAASTLGKTPAALMEDLGSFSGDLAAYGSEWEDVLLGAAAAAKQSGLEMSKLMSLTEKFTTFDSAATAVGGLNALLGGDFVNSLEMMEAAAQGPERVAGMLSDAMKAGGKSFEMMSFWERKALAEQVGMTTSELSMLMGIETEEGKKAKAEAQAKAKEQDNYRKILSSTVDIARRLELFWKGLFGSKELMTAMSDGIEAIMDALKTKAVKNAIDEIGILMGKALKFGAKILPDVVAAILWLMESFQSLVKFFGGSGTSALVAFIVVLGSLKLASGLAAVAMNKMISGTSAGISKVGNKAAEGAGKMLGFTEKVDKGSDAMKKSGPKAASAVGPLLAFGAAILMIGAGIGLAAYGFSLLVASFNGITNAGMALGAVAIVMGGFVLVLLLMIPVISALGAVTYAVGAPLLALGFVFLMMGVGVLAAAFGISLLVAALNGVSAEVLWEQSKSLMLLGAAIAIISAASVLAGPGLVILSLGLVGLAGALWILSFPLSKISEDLTNLMNVMIMPKTKGSSMFAQISSEIPTAIGHINAFTEAWEKMIKAVNMMATNPKPTIITTIMMERLFGSISSVSPKSAASTVRVIEKAKEYQKEVVKNKDNVDALVELLKAKGDVPGGGSGGGPSLDGAVIRLEVGGNRFGDYIIKTNTEYANRTGLGEYTAS